MKIIGGIIFIVGLILLVGNVSGCMRTFPYAGFLVTLIGGAILKAGDD